MHKACLIPALSCLLVLGSCRKDPLPDNLDFRAEMRSFVQEIGAAARVRDSDFIIIPQNGQQLATISVDDTSEVAEDYLNSIDGIGREDLWYGAEKDDVATDASETAAMRTHLDLAASRGITILVTDYCSTPSNVDDSYAQNQAAGYTSFAANRRDLDEIPSYPSALYGLNADTIRQLSEVRNFLYLLDASKYDDADAMVQAIAGSNYDLVIMDLFYDDNTAFSAAQVQQMRQKANGGRRLLIAYMSIGEAEDYRYYWEKGWKLRKPDWLDDRNPGWKGNYKVRYWEAAWKAYIYGTEDSYLDRIIDAGFDGAYLDIIDGFEYFEDKI